MFAVSGCRDWGGGLKCLLAWLLICPCRVCWRRDVASVSTDRLARLLRWLALGDGPLLLVRAATRFARALSSVLLMMMVYTHPQSVIILNIHTPVHGDRGGHWSYVCVKLVSSSRTMRGRVSETKWCNRIPTPPITSVTMKLVISAACS
jgi:hypothetical protein